MKILFNYFDHIHTPLSSFSQTYFYLSTPKFISLFLITHQIRFVLNYTKFKDAFC